MEIRTFNDFENLKKGAWLEDGSGIYEVVATYNEFNECIGLAEVIFKDDESDEYTLGTKNPNVTFSDVRGIEIIA
jgi:hypothetical protein|nr:MAG TPA: hypothetical protein [Caudoviricetes sp.]